MVGVEPSPSLDLATMMSACMATFDFQAMVQHSWPESLQHLKLHRDVFNCIPVEARVQFTKNCNELTQKLMAKDSPSSLVTKGEKGESSAQFHGARSNGKPFGNQSQNSNLALQSDEQTDQEEAFEQDDESNDTTSNILAAFNSSKSPVGISMAA